uniref:Uncharacterized protein n=1 Tax=Lactuca sativa TaxID=4236 RepID=A0A9R1V3C3_LACSA|nr:hypothetical protein LSAT_V11C700368630 [Lactuca sativa]
MATSCVSLHVFGAYSAYSGDRVHVQSIWGLLSQQPENYPWDFNIVRSLSVFKSLLDTEHPTGTSARSTYDRSAIDRTFPPFRFWGVTVCMFLIGTRIVGGASISLLPEYRYQSDCCIAILVVCVIPICVVRNVSTGEACISSLAGCRRGLYLIECGRGSEKVRFCEEGNKRKVNPNMELKKPGLCLVVPLSSLANYLS